MLEHGVITSMRVLIIGCGYVGIPLGRLLAREGHAVLGLRRTGAADAELRASGISPVHADVTDLAQLRRIEGRFDLVVNLVSSSKGGPEEYRQVYLEGMQNLLEWLTLNAPGRFLYTSSTSVYAQADGSWVDEQSATEPVSATSKILLEAEQTLLRAHREAAFPAIILRASGIYGPGRGHLFKQFVRGEAAMREDGASWINMIQVEDLAGALVHLATHGRPGEIYNATDDEPVTQRDFFEWLARELGKPMPPSAPPDAQRKRGLTNKRISNRKLKAAGFQFTYPTFREGYREEIQRVTNASIV